MGLVRYAGFDPGENDFSELDRNDLFLAEHLDRIRPKAGEREPRIDPRRAIELRARGLSWTEIGEQLAAEGRRSIRFTGWSVNAAVRRYKRECER